MVLEGIIAALVVEVQRTIERADICALFMALCKHSGPHEFVTHNRGVVQALNEEEDCIGANHKHADLWTQVWRNLGDWAEAGVHLRGVCGLGRTPRAKKRLP